MKNNFKENNEFIDYNHDHRDTVSLWNLFFFEIEQSLNPNSQQKASKYLKKKLF